MRGPHAASGRLSRLRVPPATAADTAVMDLPPGSGVLRFGDLALDLATGELRHSGDAAPTVLGARPTRLLALLAWRHGQLVTRDDIQSYVWSDGTTVDFDQSINQHIRQLRHALGDSAGHPTWIQTLPARGYRFLVVAALDPAPRAAGGAALAPAGGGDATASGARPSAMTGAAVHPANDGLAQPVIDADLRGAGHRAAPAMTDAAVRPASSGLAPPAIDAAAGGASDGPPSAMTDAVVPPASSGLAPPVIDAAVGAASDGPVPPMTDAVVRRASDGLAPPVIDASVHDASRARPRAVRKHRRVGAATVIGLAFAALLITTSDPGSVANTRTRDPGSAVRIAVLPMESEPGDRPRAITATEDLIAALGEAYAPNLEVIALRSVMHYRGSTAPPSAIARELGVDFVLEGRMRTQPDHARITLGLVRGRDSVHVWMRTFEPSERGGTTEAMAQDVAAALGHVLLPHRARPDVVLDADAQNDYLRGRYLLRRNPPTAVQAFAAVTARVPRSAKSWAGQALAELRSGPDRLPRAVAAASTALELDPANPEAHYVRAVAALYGEWDVERARQHFTAAIAANPAFAEAHHDLAACYSATRRHDEAIAAMQRAFALDPLAPEVVSDVGWYYYFARRYAEAATWCRRTLAIDPVFSWAHRCIVLAHMRQGDPAAALAAALDDLRARKATPSVIAAVTASGLTSYWQWDRDQIAPDRGIGDFGDRAVARIAAGDTTGALDDLERAVATRRGWLLPFLVVDPTFDPLRGQPRFEAVLRTIAAGASL